LNSYELIDSLKSHIADSDPLINRIESWYGAGSAHVFVDHDRNAPSGEDNYSVMVQLHSPWKAAGEEDRDVLHSFIVSVDMVDSVDVSTGNDNLSEYRATERLIIVAELCIAIIQTHKPTNWAMSFSLKTDTVTNFPIFCAEVEVSLLQHLTIGTDPFAVGNKLLLSDGQSKLLLVDGESEIDLES